MAFVQALFSIRERKALRLLQARWI